MTDKYRLTEEDQSLILSEQVLLAYRQLPVTIIASFILVALVVWATYGTVSTSYLIIWSSLIVIFGFVRLVAVKKFMSSILIIVRQEILRGFI